MLVLPGRGCLLVDGPNPHRVCGLAAITMAINVISWHDRFNDGLKVFVCIEIRIKIVIGLVVSLVIDLSQAAGHCILR